MGLDAQLTTFVSVNFIVFHQFLTEIRARLCTLVALKFFAISNSIFIKYYLINIIYFNHVILTYISINYILKNHQFYILMIN